MPAFVLTRDGERDLQACAERYLSESEAAALGGFGAMVLLSRRDRNAVRIDRLGTIAPGRPAFPER